jgi:hypothetical protein
MNWGLNLHNLAVPMGQIVGYTGYQDTPPTKWLAERQLLLYSLLSFDVAGTTSEASAYTDLFTK